MGAAQKMKGEHSWMAYAFWRGWILVVYSAPIWANFTNTSDTATWVSMYTWSTFAFVVTAVLMAVFNEGADRILSSSLLNIVAGALVVCGICLEYFALQNYCSVDNACFIVGSLITGVGTAPIALFSGNLYARFSSADAYSKTILSETWAGLIFFFAIASFPQVALVLAAVLPLLGMGVCVLERYQREKHDPGLSLSFLDTPVCGIDGKNIDGTSGSRNNTSVFVRFLIVVVVLSFVATFAKNAGFAPVDVTAAGEGLRLGLVAIVGVTFVSACLITLSPKFDFYMLYYPIVVLLSFALIMAFNSMGESVFAMACVCFSYNLFNMLLSCVLIFASKGDTWKPTQVFGLGRAAYATGSLIGLLAGTNSLTGSIVNAEDGFSYGLVLAFAVAVLGIFMFRETDAYRLTHGATNVAATMAAAAPAQTRPSGPTPEQFAAASKLTNRETEVFLLLVQGQRVRGISEQLYVSENTTKTHIHNIYTKLGVRNRQGFDEAVRELKKF